MRQRERPRYHARDPQTWAVDQVRQRHNEALLTWGEYCVFVLLWRAEDYDSGLVGRCPICWGRDATEGRMAEAFKQPVRKDCIECLGTTFEGGFKAKIVRPALWNLSAEADRDAQRGQVSTRTGQVESTEDFRLRVGDFIIRADNSRWQVQNFSPFYLSTGFQTTTRQRNIIGFNMGQVTEEDPSSVAFLIPPIGKAATDLLDVDRERFPEKFAERIAELEVYRGASLLEPGKADNKIVTWEDMSAWKWQDFDDVSEPTASWRWRDFNDPRT